MTRILETLRHGDGSRLQLHDTPATARVFEAPSEVGVPESAPFIEVGGPQRELHASPDVLAAGPHQESLSGQANQQGRVFVPAPPASTDSGLVQVSFRPFPAAPALLRPACDRFVRDLVVFHQPEHAISEQYRTLLAGLESQLVSGQPHALFFTAPRPGVGVTTVLLNLALTVAIRGRARVAVIDANLPRPAVAERLGLFRSAGLREVLAGSVSPQRILRDSGQDGLSVVTAGTTGPATLGLLAGEVMRALLRYLRGRFDWTFVDAPCWDGSREVGTLASQCDAVYLVLPHNGMEASAITEMQRSIEQHGARLRGCILTHR